MNVPPRISNIAPLFIVRDVPAALAFYRDKLAFDVTFQGPESSDIFFGIVERGRHVADNEQRRDVGDAWRHVHKAPHS